MADNILLKVSQTISYDEDANKVLYELCSKLSEVDKMYSYIVYNIHKDEVLVGWKVTYHISQQEKYNTISVSDAITDIMKIISSPYDITKRIIGYKQPPIELMVRLYEPLMQKMALEQSERWNDIEYEDALSMCKLCMVRLYRKGYYVHKHLLRKAFLNEILLTLRPEKNRPEVLSLDTLVHDDGDGEKMHLIDVLPDMKTELEKEQRELDEVFTIIFTEVKRLLLEFMSERQIEQLLRDYANKHTTSWSRKTMQKIKQKFKTKNITLQYFKRFYE